MLFEEMLMMALMAVFASTYAAYLEPTYFVGWGTLALINAGVAQGKQKSGLPWFLLSIFLGPLATLILVLLPRG